MRYLYGSVFEDIEDFFTGLSGGDYVAVILIGVVALLIGFLIGALLFRSAGYKKGRARGERDAATIATKRAKEEVSGQIQQVIRVAKEKQSALLAENAADKAALLEAQEKLAQMEKSHAEAATSRAETEISRQAAVQAVLDAERSKAEAQQALLAAEKTKEEAEKIAKEAEDRIRAFQDSEAKGDTIVKTRKKKLALLTKEEILSYAEGLDEYLPTSIYTRGGEDLPDSCRVGICTFMLVYQRKNMVKLLLRLHKKTAAALESQFKLFTRAVYPKGDDWYKWILSSEVTDLDVVTAAIRMAYKYVFLMNYDEKTREINVTYANRDEIKMNEEILKYKDLPDRDFIVASDAADGKEIAYHLYGKKEMSDYCRTLGGLYPVSVTESDSELSPNIFRVADKTFLMAYEKDGVSKMIFRMSEEGFIRVVKKHPGAAISTFPKAKGYHWYVVTIDESFTSNADIESIIRSACVYVYETYCAL